MNSLTFTLFLVPGVALLSLLYAAVKAFQVARQDAGTDAMQRISLQIRTGARAFLRVEYQVITGFVLLVSGFLLLCHYCWPHSYSSPWVAGSFLVGALFSGIAGFVGMDIATRANVRTAEAARHSLVRAFRVSFGGGSVMAAAVVGLALLGLGSIFAVGFGWKGISLGRHQLYTLLEVLTGFSLGAESIALFSRVAGGIYTKGADVGADIVGKVESGIPEDDPRNPAVIADNVGDNVGDIAGMGADLFGSYVATLLAAMVLGAAAYQAKNLMSLGPVLLPLMMAAAGTVASLITISCLRMGSEKSSVHRLLRVGNTGAIGVTSGFMYLCINFLFPEEMVILGHTLTQRALMGVVFTALPVGTLISELTAYFTTAGRKPVDWIIRQSLAGPATNVISGLSIGMLSTVLPVLVFAAEIWSSFVLAGFYGVAIAAVAMMTTTAVQLAIDAFGPIADNAGGIVEMSGLPQVARERTDVLDAVGNTTAASGKGFAIASAALTSLALFAAFVGTTGLQHIDIYKAEVLAGLLAGGMVPFFFSALAIQAVGKTAGKMVEEVRRQFREIKGLLEGKQTPDYGRCVSIATHAALRETILPALLAIVAPLCVGLLAGPEVLAAFLAGVMVVGVPCALFQCNAGGAWDNAKKAFEKGVEIDGKKYGKGSMPHKATVIGDTVGDPFKDTSGPSINILIKLTAIVALMLAPYL